MKSIAITIIAALSATGAYFSYAGSDDEGLAALIGDAARMAQSGSSDGAQPTVPTLDAPRLAVSAPVYGPDGTRLGAVRAMTLRGGEPVSVYIRDARYAASDITVEGERLVLRASDTGGSPAMAARR